MNLGIYCIDRADGLVRIWRGRGGRLSYVGIRENDRWGGAHVMVWAGISHRHRTQLVFLEIPGRGAGLTAQGYIDQVLRPVVLPFMQRRDGFQLQKTMQGHMLLPSLSSSLRPVEWKCCDGLPCPPI